MTHDHARLREAVARAMWASPLDDACAPVPWEDGSDEARAVYLMEASAAIAVVLEEAARKLDGWGDIYGRNAAAAIRAFIPKGEQ